MHATFRGLVSLALTVATVTAAAGQTVIDDSRARASLRPGYSGHGLDWDASVDSRLLAGAIRFRAGVGRGRWVDEFEQRPPVGLDPTIARVAGAMLFYGRPRGHSGRIQSRGYAGPGISAFLPRGVDISPQAGLRLVAGVDVSGHRWTAGPEVEIDLPLYPRTLHRAQSPSVPGTDGTLAPAFRIGFAIRRAF